MSTALTVVQPQELARRANNITAEDLMPVLDLATAIRRHNFMVEVTKTLMNPGVDFGVIPGTGNKPTLLKPGAEKLCTLYGLSPEFVEMEACEDWDGAKHGGEPFFYYRYKAVLSKNGITLGEGVGSCNSWEEKYRCRAMNRACPHCKKEAIIKGKEEYGGGWLCFAKKGGCGAKFPDGDQSIEGQTTGKIANPGIYDQINTIQKMAQKRALIAGVLVATNASEFYTQDIDDMQVIDVGPTPEEVAARRIEEERNKLERQRQARKPAPSTKPGQPKPIEDYIQEGIARMGVSIKNIVEEFGALKRAMLEIEPDLGETIYRGVLNNYRDKDGNPMEHANDCKRVGMEKTRAAYGHLWRTLDEMRRIAQEERDKTPRNPEVSDADVPAELFPKEAPYGSD